MSIRDESSTWDTSTLLVVLGCAGVVAWSLVATVGVHLWALMSGNTATWNPVHAAIRVFQGQYPGCGPYVGVVAVLLGVLILVGVLLQGARGGRRKRGDSVARLVGKGRDIAPLTKSATLAKAQRLGVQVDTPGLPVARTVSDSTFLYSSWEDVCINISGPRTGKTTCWVVPRILAAPGAVVATSNKRDIVDDTKRARATKGRVIVFDPQSIEGAPQQLWWNPLSYVTDAVHAQALTQVFVDAQRDPNSQGNAFFDSAARDLVAGLLLAAAVAGRTLMDVHRWLNNQNDMEPADILRHHKHTMMAQSVEGMMNLVPETRSGVFGGAAQIMSFVLNDQAMAWVTPRVDVAEFSPADFVASTDTLYCLSQEGRGSAAPIVTALTVAVVEAAIHHAKTQAKGRLATPMLIELDEAANVCRWRELPDLYSHFGSRGICVDTVLQSYSQGSAVWGEAGIRKLWSAANVKVYGGGVSERDFLAQLSDLIGVHYTDQINVSTGVYGRGVSTTKNAQQRPIATISDLAALPAGRAWVFASGTVPTLARLVPFWERSR